MSIYEKHVFICENKRNDSLPCCGAKESAEMTNKLKKMVLDAGLKSKVRINRSGCLGECASGVAMVIYPAGIWLKNITIDDVDNIFKKYLQT